jgi:hypothetical protein
MGSNDQPFHQNATGQNVSSTGACISGLEHELKVGDVIGVQYETRKARCKVIWVLEAGGLKKFQVGVQLVADQECPWTNQLPVETRTNVTAVSNDNRRNFERHKISFPLEFRDERVNMPMRVNATDISGSGCYVESVMPFAIGISLRVDFWIDQERITTSAVVRTRDPGVGMGVEFTGMTGDSQKRFQTYLDKANPGLLVTEKKDKEKDSE